MKHALIVVTQQICSAILGWYWGMFFGHLIVAPSIGCWLKRRGWIE
jgi:hypothetical protein